MITYKGKKYRNFTSVQLEKIEREYPDTDTSCLAESIGLTLESVYWAAGTLGVKKNKAYMVAHASEKFKNIGSLTRFKKGQTPWNKGKKGINTGGFITQYKPGNLPHNTKYDGYISLRKDKNGHSYYFIRIEMTKWKPLHRFVWEMHYGPIPKGYNIQFKDKNTLNSDIDNLYIISRSEQINLNTIHRYPPELKQALRFITKINKLTKNEKNKSASAQLTSV